MGDWHEYRVDWDPTYTQFYIDGALMFDRANPNRRPRTDFEVGLFPAEAGR